MLGKTIRGYFQYLQDTLNPYDIVFDTLYTQQIENFTQAMTNYNLRQMYDFDTVKALYLTKEQLDKISGRSYNVLQYKYQPPVKNDTTSANNQIYKITYKPATDPDKKPTITITDLITGRTTRELSNEQEAILQAEFKAYQESLSKTDPMKSMERTIHQTTAFDVTPHYPTNIQPDTEITRFGFYADIPLDCRFVTSSTETFEQFIILYNILFHKINPPAYITAREWGEQTLYPIRTKYSEITSAQQIDTNVSGNLLEVSFSTTLSVLLLSNFYKKSAYINQIELHWEAVRNSKR